VVKEKDQQKRPGKRQRLQSTSIEKEVVVEEEAEPMQEEEEECTVKTDKNVPKEKKITKDKVEKKSQKVSEVF